jgi:hypothetical protein
MPDSSSQDEGSVFTTNTGTHNPSSNWAHNILAARHPYSPDLRSSTTSSDTPNSDLSKTVSRFGMQYTMTAAAAPVTAFFAALTGLVIQNPNDKLPANAKTTLSKLVKDPGIIAVHARQRVTATTLYAAISCMGTSSTPAAVAAGIAIAAAAEVCTAGQIETGNLSRTLFSTQASVNANTFATLLTAPSRTDVQKKALGHLTRANAAMFARNVIPPSAIALTVMDPKQQNPLQTVAMAASLSFVPHSFAYRELISANHVLQGTPPPALKLGVTELGRIFAARFLFSSSTMLTATAANWAYTQLLQEADYIPDNNNVNLRQEGDTLKPKSSDQPSHWAHKLLQQRHPNSPNLRTI